MSEKTYPMLINGQTVQSKNSIEVDNPRTGEVLGLVPDIDTEGIQAVLDGAESGFKAWSATKPAERKEIILRYADLLDEHSERIIALLMAETGKPLDNATYDFGMLPTCLRFFVEEFERLDQPVLHDTGKGPLVVPGVDLAAVGTVQPAAPHLPLVTCDR